MAVTGVGLASGTPGGACMTLMDWAKALDPKGAIAYCIEMLSQANEILDDMLWVQGNLPTGHKTTIRTGLPQAYWRLMNQGIPRGKSTKAPITETCGMLGAFSDIDVDLASLSGNERALRASEDTAFLESMNQQMAGALYYNNVYSAPSAFMGLSPRYPNVAGSTVAGAAQTSQNVIDAGGLASTNTSMWLIGWGPNAIHGIFPQGSKAGFQQIDRGQQPCFDANGNKYFAWETEYKWHMGLCVRDWRFAVRIANIDASLLMGNAPANLLNFMVRAIHRLPIQPGGAGPVRKSDAPTLTGARMSFYCNRTIATWLDIQAMNKTNMLLTIKEFDGQPRTAFRGIPIRICDQLLNTESRVI